jgi:Uma2 family endonuclease
MAQSALSPSPLLACYDGPPPPSWDLDETPVPESTLHAEAVVLLWLVLAAWAKRVGLPAYVARNLALRWLEAKPKVGLDPDVALYAPPPPGSESNLGSVTTWLPGHAAPQVAVEVVSAGHPTKDYVEGLAKYAASGTGELWVFDPLLAGPRAGGGPYRLQVWARDERGRFEPVYAGEGPARSPYLKAWLVVVEGGERLRVSDDREGRRLWPTAEEVERAAKEAERAAKEAALDELVRLRAEIAALRGER